MKYQIETEITARILLSALLSFSFLAFDFRMEDVSFVLLPPVRSVTSQALVGSSTWWRHRNLSSCKISAVSLLHWSRKGLISPRVSGMGPPLAPALAPCHVAASLLRHGGHNLFCLLTAAFFLVFTPWAVPAL